MSRIHNAIRKAEKNRLIRLQVGVKEEKDSQGEILSFPKVVGSVFDHRPVSFFHPGQFYHLTKEPFHITPDPEFLFLSPSHKQALDSIIYGVKNKKGFIVITGEVGVGKTTILRSYLEGGTNQKTKIIYLFNSNVTFKNLLKTLYKELGFRTKTDDSVEMLNGLYRILMREYKEGNMVLLIVDEAQNMPMQTLENLRMLSNFETSKDKLLQIVMIGQCEFEQMLNQYSLRQLKERIAIRCSIAPFTKKESVAYIKHRLEKASENNNQVFTKEALKAIIKEAKGIPRHLNILCDNALITGFRNQKNPVNLKIVKDVIGDFKGKEKSSFPKWMLASAILLILIAYVTLILAYKDLILSGARVLGLALVRLFLHSIFYTLTLP